MNFQKIVDALLDAEHLIENLKEECFCDFCMGDKSKAKCFRARTLENIKAAEKECLVVVNFMQAIEVERARSEKLVEALKGVLDWDNHAENCRAIHEYEIGRCSIMPNFDLCDCRVSKIKSALSDHEASR